MSAWTWTLLLFLVGCSTPVHQSLEEVRAGMDKDQVLNSAGNPKRTFREKSQDKWIYQYFENDQEYMRIVIFDDGKVVRVTKPSAKKDWERELEGTNTMEEYEKKAKAHQKRRGASNFKSIDGGPADPEQP